MASAILDRIRLPRMSGNISETSLVSTKGSGKTVILDCLNIKCKDRANKEDSKFRYMIYDANQTVVSDTSLIEHGTFPEPTPSGNIYEAVADLKFYERLGIKWRRVPFFELPGEDVRRMIGIVKQAEEQDAFKGEQILSSDELKALYEKILSASSFIIPVSVPRTLAQTNNSIPGLEHEPKGVSTDPDVNAHAIIQNIFEFKMENDLLLPNAIIILLTKYDVCKEWLEVSRKLPLVEKDGTPVRKNVLDFMRIYLSQTNSALQFFDIKKLIVIPVWVWADPNNPKKILIDSKTQRPFYNHRGYDMLIDTLRDIG
ncbi:MAG: DO-GTPase2 protein [Thermoproteota archaeon]|nr:DO-GTPase2 protein [Thermoproteota archaeon]